MQESKDLRGVLKLHESFTEEEYWASKCMSYSIIKDVPDNPEVIIKPREQVDKEWLTFGTIVDILLTEPASVVDEKIFINDSVPTEQYKAMADYIIENNIDLTWVINGVGSYPGTSGWEEIVEDIYVKSGSKVNWTAPVKRQKLLDNCRSYIELLTTHKDQIIVSTDLFNEATLVAQTFSTHPWTKALFIDEKTQKRNNVEVLYQFKIKYVYEGVQCKSKFDILVVNHNNKVITPVDIKTGSDLPRHFIKTAIFKYKYCYQECLYTEGLKVFIKNIEELKDYTVGDFRFAYVSRLRPAYPIIAKVGELLHNVIKTIGISTDLYELPALDEIMDSIHIYMKDVEEGKTTFEPYELRAKNGEYEVDEPGVAGAYNRYF
jgi:hypothetical protein